MSIHVRWILCATRSTVSCSNDVENDVDSDSVCGNIDSYLQDALNNVDSDHVTATACVELSTIPLSMHERILMVIVLVAILIRVRRTCSMTQLVPGTSQVVFCFFWLFVLLFSQFSFFCGTSSRSCSIGRSPQKTPFYCHANTSS